MVSSYRGGLDLIKRRAESNVQHVARRQRSLLIGSNPFNSGNEFQRTILIRASRRAALRLLFFSKGGSPFSACERELGQRVRQFNDRAENPARVCTRLPTPRARSLSRKSLHTDHLSIILTCSNLDRRSGDCDFTNDLWGSRAGGMIGSNSRIDLLRCVASK